MERSNTIAVGPVDLNSLVSEQGSHDLNVTFVGRIMKRSPASAVGLVGVDSFMPEQRSRHRSVAALGSPSRYSHPVATTSIFGAKEQGGLTQNVSAKRKCRGLITGSIPTRGPRARCVT